MFARQTDPRHRATPEGDGQCLPMVGAFSVNPRHAVVSPGVRWRYMASSDTLSMPQPEGLSGSPKATFGDQAEGAQIRNEGFETTRVDAGHLRLGSWTIDGSEPEPPSVWYDSTTNFAVTLPSTPADRGNNGELSRMRIRSGGYARICANPAELGFNRLVSERSSVQS